MASSIGLSWVWVTGLITFALGIACGAGFTYLMAGNTRRRTSDLKEKLDQLQQELDGYRDQVGQHFRKTSELVQAMTDSYRNVYEHLAKGSHPAWILHSTPNSIRNQTPIPRYPTPISQTLFQTRKPTAWMTWLRTPFSATHPGFPTCTLKNVLVTIHRQRNPPALGSLAMLPDINALPGSQVATTARHRNTE